jgi:hypothetical protein
VGRADDSTASQYLVVLLDQLPEPLPVEVQVLDQVVQGGEDVLQGRAEAAYSVSVSPTGKQLLQDAACAEQRYDA